MSENKGKSHPSITFISNSGSGDVIIGQNQDNDQANKAKVDQSVKQVGFGNEGGNFNETNQANILEQ